MQTFLPLNKQTFKEFESLFSEPSYDDDPWDKSILQKVREYLYS